MLKDYFEVPNKPAIKSGNVLSCDFTDHETFIPQPLDFTRNTLATYVDCNGLIKVSGVTNTNLSPPEDFATDFNSNPVSGTAVNNPDGTITFTNSTSNGANVNLSNRNITVGKTYQIKFTISNYVQGNFRMSVGNQTTASVTTGNGTYIFYVTYNSGNSSNYFYTGNSTFTVSDISVKEVDLNIPRIDYLTEIGKAKELQKPSLLLEPQSTNLFPTSNDVAATAATKINNQIISPEGLKNAALYVENTATASHGAIRSGMFPAAGATTYTLSVFAKAKERHLLRLNLYADGASNLTDNFDLINGTVSDANSTIEDFGNGWYRCSTTKTFANGGGYNFAAVYMGKSTNTYYYEGDGTSGLYLFGFQVEQQGHATSYIPTSGSTVTRNLEQAIDAGSIPVFNGEEGTFYGEFASLGKTGTTRRMSVSDGSNINRATITISSGNPDRINFLYKAGGSNQFTNSLPTSVDTTNMNKVAFTWKQGEYRVVYNGQQDATGSITTLATVPFREFGFTRNGVADRFYARVREIKIFRRALTLEELKELTNNIV